MEHSRTASLATDAPAPPSARTCPILWGRVVLASLIEIRATVLQLLRRPLLLQAMVARVVAGVAIVLEGVSLRRAAIIWDTGRRWQLIGASPVNSPAAIEFFSARPTLDPLEWPQVLVPGIAIKRAWRSGGLRRRRWRSRWGWRCRRWGWCRWTSDVVMLTTPALFVERPHPLALTIVRLGGCDNGSWSRRQRCRPGTQLWQEVQEERNQEQ